MRATQQLQYAIYGIFDLAYNGGSRPIRIQEISDRQNIPTRYLEQIFQKLRRGGLVASKRGPGGGYLLKRSAEEITLADVLLSIQGELLSRGDSSGDAVAENPAFVWELIHAGLDRSLGGFSIADLCREAARRGMDRAESEPAMYHI